MSIIIIRKIDILPRTIPAISPPDKDLESFEGELFELFEFLLEEV